MNIPDQYSYNNIRNVSDFLRLNAELSPHKQAIIYPDPITYKELEEKVKVLSTSFNHSGIKAGIKVLVMVPMGIDFLAITFSLLRIGAIPVMVDPGMGIKAMRPLLAEIGLKVFIGNSKAQLLRLVFPQVFNTVEIKFTTGPVCFKGTRRLKYQTFENPDDYPSYYKSPDDMAAIFYTSGSTGKAKGVIFTSGMLKNQIEITKSIFNIGSEERDLCTFPLLGLFAICHGNSSVIADMDMLHPARINPAKVVRNIVDFQCTQMFGSPMILEKLAGFCLKKDIKLHSLQKVISAGAPVRQKVLESFSRVVPATTIIHTPYGATEALPVTNITSEELFKIYSDNLDKRENICVGKPVAGLDVRIIEITDNPFSSWKDVKVLPIDTVGEIVVKGPWISKNYFKRNEANILSKIPDQTSGAIWHRMGDLGKIDINGRIWFYGRKTHKVDTQNGVLFTIPCEAVYNLHPSVARSALVGINANESHIKTPVICIQLKSGFHPTKKLFQELLEFGKTTETTKIIQNILFIKKFPVDPRHNAKIFREKLAVWAQNKLK